MQETPTTTDNALGARVPVAGGALVTFVQASIVAAHDPRASDGLVADKADSAAKALPDSQATSTSEDQL